MDQRGVELVRRVLERAETRRALCDVVDGWRNKFEHPSDENVALLRVMSPSDEFHSHGSIVWDRDAPELKLAVQESVMSRLPIPAPITEREVRNLAVAYLTVDRQYMKKAYDRFVEEVAATFQTFIGPDAYSIRLTPHEGLQASEPLAQWRLTELWRAGGLFVRVEPRRFKSSIDYYQDDAVDTCEIFAVIEAFDWTPGAFGAACSEATSVLRSAMRSFRLTGHFGELPRHPARRRFAILKWCLGTHWSRLEQHDSFRRRVQNAIRLLWESDAQEHDTVALVLCFAAIESLLGSDDLQGRSLTASLASRTATLLQPKGDLRPRAIRAIKPLYAIRSRLVHGSNVEEHALARRKTRLLAAGVLNAVIEWALFNRRLTGEKAKARDFGSELASAEREEKRFPGVPSGLFRCLPEP